MFIVHQISFSPGEHAAIQKALQQKLGPEYISQRPGANGQKVQVQSFGDLNAWSGESIIAASYLGLDEEDYSGPAMHTYTSDIAPGHE